MSAAVLRIRILRISSTPDSSCLAIPEQPAISLRGEADADVSVRPEIPDGIPENFVTQDLSDLILPDVYWDSTQPSHSGL